MSGGFGSIDNMAGPDLANPIHFEECHLFMKTTFRTRKKMRKDLATSSRGSGLRRDPADRAEQAQPDFLIWGGVGVVYGGPIC